jgi:hypothetical protein
VFRLDVLIGGVAAARGWLGFPWSPVMRKIAFRACSATAALVLTAMVGLVNQAPAQQVQLPTAADKPSASGPPPSTEPIEIIRDEDANAFRGWAVHPNPLAPIVKSEDITETVTPLVPRGDAIPGSYTLRTGVKDGKPYTEVQHQVYFFPDRDTRYPAKELEDITMNGGAGASSKTHYVIGDIHLFIPEGAKSTTELRPIQLIAPDPITGVWAAQRREKPAGSGTTQQANNPPAKTNQPGQGQPTSLGQQGAGPQNPNTPGEARTGGDPGPAGKSTSTGAAASATQTEPSGSDQSGKKGSGNKVTNGAPGAQPPPSEKSKSPPSEPTRSVSIHSETNLKNESTLLHAKGNVGEPVSDHTAPSHSPTIASRTSNVASGAVSNTVSTAAGRAARVVAPTVHAVTPTVHAITPTPTRSR